MDHPKPGASLILIVEDDDATRLILEAAVRSAGYSVSVASSAEQAIAQLQAVLPDAVITDVHLPGADGLSVAAWAKERDPSLPVLVITAEARLDVAMRAVRSADDFLLKPVDPVLLVEKLAPLLARRRRRPRELILAVGAHPDDVELGCGGALLAARARDTEVAILTLSGGERGGHRHQRAREAESSAALLGARLFIGDLEDTAISDGGETIRLIEETIAAVRPTAIYIHSIHDLHQDHRAAHQATMVAARAVPTVLAYQSPSATVDFRPSVFIDIADVLDGKLRLLAQFASQSRPYLLPDAIRAAAIYWGRFAGHRPAEPLELVRQSVG